MIMNVINAMTECVIAGAIKDGREGARIMYCKYCGIGRVDFEDERCDCCDEEEEEHG